MKFKLKKLENNDTVKVYDIQVKDTENFTIGKNKIVVHNCFLGYVPDSIQGLIDHTGEARWLSILGGGVGGHWRGVRGVTDKSPGTIPFIHTMDSDMDAYMQGKMRRGSYAAYMDVSHPDIIEFLNLRVPTGDVSRKCHSKGFHNAINITDNFMEAVLSNKGWDLIHPHNGEIAETVGARDLWQQILEVRYRTGEPYLCFTDTANKFLPKRQKELGLLIHGSNLCLEGSTLITIKIDDVEEEIRMDDFNEKFTMGYYTDVLVKSYDIENDTVVWEKITASGQTGITNELYEIESDDGKHIIRCTANHKIYTKNRGYVEAQYLEEDDDIVFDS